MALCEEYREDCYGCHLREKGIALAGDATPSRRDDRRFVPPRRHEPTWEKGRAGEYRPDGSFMPYLTPTGGRMGIKSYSENRRKVDERVRRLKTDPNVLSRKD